MYASEISMQQASLGPESVDESESPEKLSVARSTAWLSSGAGWVDELEDQV